MHLKVSYIMRCEYCREEKEYTVRDLNVHKDLTDKDIRKMMSVYTETPQLIRYCPCCELETLQTRVAWIGTVD